MFKKFAKVCTNQLKHAKIQKKIINLKKNHKICWLTGHLFSSASAFGWFCQPLARTATFWLGMSFVSNKLCTNWSLKRALHGTLKESHKGEFNEAFYRLLLKST